MNIFTHFIDVYQRYADEEAILLYQFGKVGSTALEASLPAAIHQHSLYGGSPCHVHIEQRRAGVKFWVGALGDALKRMALKRRKTMKIISIVREPLARNQSMFFQDLGHWLYKYVGLDHHDTREAGFDYLFKVYEEAFDHTYVLDWYDREFKRFTGVDVYSEGFDQQTGYQIIKRPGMEILLLKYEQLADMEGVISEFCGRKVVLDTANVGTDKWYGDIYRRFKRDYRTSHSKLECLYKSRYMKAFYSPKEISGFCEKYLPGR